MGWEAALEPFLEEWKHRGEVVGILVCGSYITGNPSKRSDIDVHIILRDDCNWRERGNRVINGYLIEYFVNPPQQIRSYFQEDYQDRRTMSMVQFLTGRVYVDKSGVVKGLIEEAREWKDKPYEALPAPVIELKKYGLWDVLDNLLDCYEGQRSDFQFVYDQSLLNLYGVYCSVLGVEEVPYYQLLNYFTDPQYLKKYLKEPFPDAEFGKLFVRAMQSQERDEQVKLYRVLAEHVLGRSGGFNIDGWKLRSPLDLL